MLAAATASDYSSRADVHGLEIDAPTALEMRLNHIAGTVTNGLFARRGADVQLLGTATGVRRIDYRI